MKYYGDRTKLLKDLLREGFLVVSAAPNDKVPGKRFEIRFRSGTLIEWDEETGSIDAKGASGDEVKLIRYTLIRLYAGGWWSSFWGRRHELIISIAASVLLTLISVIAGYYLGKK